MTDFGSRFNKASDRDPEEEKFRRLMRRMEHCARARDESTKILSLRFAQRDQVKASAK